MASGVAPSVGEAQIGLPPPTPEPALAARPLRDFRPRADRSSWSETTGVPIARGMAGDVVSVLGAQALGLAAGLVASIIAARALGPSGRGIFALVTLWVGFFALAASLSSGYGIIYEIRGSRASLTQALSSGLGLSILLGGVSAALALLVAAAVSGTILNDVPFGCIVVGAVALPAAIFNGFSALALTGAGRVREAAVLGAMSSLSAFALLAFLVLALRLGVWGAVAASSLSSFAAMAMILIWFRPHFRASHMAQPQLWLSSVRFGAKLHGGMLAQWANYSIDRFLINVFLGAGAVGIYAVAAGLAERLWVLPGAVGASLFSRTGGDSSDDARVTGRACRTALWTMSGACAAVALLAPAAVPMVFGPRFAGAADALLLLLPGVLLLTAGKVLAPYVCNRGRPLLATYISVGALVLTVLLNLLLVPRFGIEGAAVASSISYGANGLAFAIVFLRMSALPLRELVRFPGAEIEVIVNRGMRRLAVPRVRCGS
jgi:O-antigen/teichoic acid export membrane protein